MKSFADIDQENRGTYLELLSAISKFSALFSDSDVPYINYRVAENIFCRSFDAMNVGRADNAFDANYMDLGVGLKTFLCPTDNSTEKVAEFNSLSHQLSQFRGKDLALELGKYRNNRIELAKRLYDVENAVYHIVARRPKELILFETDYNNIDLKNIKVEKETRTSLQFYDGINYYSYNYSKSTLFRKFQVPNNSFSLNVDIINDPYALLLDMFKKKEALEKETKSYNAHPTIALPLFSNTTRHGRFVPEKSGLNQWNAAGRKRDYGEMYIPISINVHRNYPDFFPNRDNSFKLEIPTGEIFDAKVCQQNSKALMTNPNNALSDWLMRKVLQLDEGILATYEKLTHQGFDSVLITKKSKDHFLIDVTHYDDYYSNLE